MWGKATLAAVGLLLSVAPGAAAQGIDFGTDGMVTIAGTEAQPWLGASGSPVGLDDGAAVVAAWRQLTADSAGLFVLRTGRSTGWTSTDTGVRSAPAARSAAIVRQGDWVVVATGTSTGVRLQWVAVTTGQLDAARTRNLSMGGTTAVSGLVITSTGLALAVTAGDRARLVRTDGAGALASNTVLGGAGGRSVAVVRNGTTTGVSVLRDTASGAALTTPSGTAVAFDGESGIGAADIAAPGTFASASTTAVLTRRAPDGRTVLRFVSATGTFGTSLLLDPGRQYTAISTGRTGAFDPTSPINTPRQYVHLAYASPDGPAVERVRAGGNPTPALPFRPSTTGCAATARSYSGLGQIDWGPSTGRRRRLVGVALCDGGDLRITAGFADNAVAVRNSVTSLNGRFEPAPAGQGRIAEDLLDVDVLFGPTPARGVTIDATPVVRLPMRRAPMRRAPMRRAPMRRAPMRRAPLRLAALTSDVARTALATVTLRRVPLHSGLTWTDLLAGSPFAGASLDDVTLADALTVPAVLDRTFGDVDLADTPLGDVSIQALLLAPLPIAVLREPDGGWCAMVDCDRFDPAMATLVDLELGGVDTTAYFSEPLPVTAPTPRGHDGLDTPLSAIPLRDFAFAESTLGDLQASDVAALLSDCDEECAARTLAELRAERPAVFGTHTIGDLLALMPVDPGVVLAEVIGGAVQPQYLAIETAPLPRLLAAPAPVRARGHNFSTQVDCDQVRSTDFTSLVPPGSTALGLFVGQQQLPLEATTEPTVFRGRIGEDFVCPAGATGLRSISLTTNRSAGVTLGPEAGGASEVVPTTPPPSGIPGGGPLPEEVGDRSAPIFFAPLRDNQEHGDTPDTAYRNALPRPWAERLVAFKRPGDPVPALTDGDLHLRYLESATDVDYHRVPAPPPGTTVTVTLSHLPVDADLAVYGADPSELVTPSSRRPEGLRAAAEARDPSLSADDAVERGETETDAAPESFPPVLTDAFGPDAPASLDRAVLRATSARRGTADERLEVRASAADAGGDLIVAVRGQGGAISELPYILRATQGVVPDEPPCVEAPAATGAAEDAGAFPELPLDPATRTLILVNRRRTVARFGAQRTDAMFDALDAYARRPEVRGIIAAVESDPASSVEEAYAAWDADRCDTTAPQRAAREVTATIDRLAGGLDELRHVVLVGADDVLPQVRIPDRTTYANEDRYAEEAMSGGRETAVSSALRHGLLLSDDPYGDLDPETAIAGSRYVPDVALGRLVETPEDVIEQLDRYRRSGGRLDAHTAYVSGYDFLKDSATDIADRLEARKVKVERRIDDTSDNAELARGLQLDTGIGAIGAHFSHTAAISAEAELSRRYSDVVDVGEVTLSGGRLLLSVGCHAGLNDPDTAGGTLDWAQRSGQAGGVLVANTGFGYGDSEAVAYSERLASAVTAMLATGEVTAGQALLYAKQRFAADTLVRNDFDAKVSEQLTFFGLPTFRVGTRGTEARSAVRDVAALRGAGPPRAIGDPVVVTSDAQRIDTPQGTYWAERGAPPTAAPGRPLQPVAVRDVTSPAGRAHGALLTGLVSSEVPGVTPKVSAPTIDRAGEEPSRDPGDVVFPQALATVRTAAAPGGIADRLLVATGQYRGSGGPTGTQRLFERVEVEVLRSGSDDFVPPRVVAVTGVVEGRVVAFAAETAGGDVARGTVLFREDDDATWRRVELGDAGDGRWTTRVTLDDDASQVSAFLVQVADEAGNVGSATGKGEGTAAAPLPAPDTAAATVALNGAPAGGGVFTSPVNAASNGGTTTGLEIQVDRSSALNATSAAIAGEGPHVLGLTSVDDTTGKQLDREVLVTVDRRPPALDGAPERAPDVVHVEGDARRSFFTAPVAIAWRCADAAAGIATCPAAQLVATETTGTTSDGSAIDRIGRTAQATSSEVVVDLAPPHARITTRPRAKVGPAMAEDRIAFTAGDAVAGLGGPPVVEFAPAGGGAPFVATSTIHCEDDERRACSGHAGGSALPPSGAYDVRVRAVDRAGRPGLSDPVRVTVVNPDRPAVLSAPSSMRGL